MKIKDRVLKIFISGITGKVGQLLTPMILEDKQLELVGGSCSSRSSKVSEDIGKLIGQKKIGVNVSKDIPQSISIDLIIDFSSPAGSMIAIETALDKGIPILIGTTGFNSSQKNDITKASRKIPVLLASNTSPGIAILKNLISHSRNIIKEDFSLNISEIHHAEKKDAPSGTAIDLEETIKVIYPKKEVSIESIREGDNPGEHKLSLNLGDEIIELTHKALDRKLFAKGSIIGAKWLVNRQPGFYTMQDIYS